MKFVLLSFCVLALTIIEVQSSDKDDLLNKCLKENDIKEADITSLASQKDPKVRCLMSCVFEKEGSLKNGQLDKEEMKKNYRKDFPKISEEKASEVVDTCTNLVKDLKEMCDKTNFIIVCMEEERKKLDIK